MGASAASLATFPSVTIAAEIERQRQLDRHHPPHLGRLGARVRAVAEAQQAVTERQLGALPALRQSLLDLAVSLRPSRPKWRLPARRRGAEWPSAALERIAGSFPSNAHETTARTVVGFP